MRILLIEDNPGDVRLVQEMLKTPRGDYIIEVVERLGAGLELLLSHQVDVVLLDMNLPDSRGLETLTSLQAHFPRLPVVVTTAIADEKIAVGAVALGAQDYLVKEQTDSRLLRRAVAYAIERKKTEEALRQSEKNFHELADRVQDVFCCGSPVPVHLLEQGIRASYRGRCQ